MKKIKCMIVDDEPLAHTVLEEYISKLSSLEIVSNCYNGFDAISFLQQNKVDLVLLDINMPDFSGMDFLESLQYKPHVIITTAYAEYAVKSYEYSVSDYLLKPFSFERFLKAINKIHIKPAAEGEKVMPGDSAGDFIFLKADKVNHKVLFDDIHYIEAYGNFLKVYFGDQMIMITESMKNIERQLPEDTFLRVHRSYIVSMKKIGQIAGNILVINENEIPIGINYKVHLKNVLSRFNLEK